MDWKRWPNAADIRLHLEWLLSPPALDPCGLPVAWVEDDGTGEVYPESAAYLISLLLHFARYDTGTRYADAAHRMLLALDDRTRDMGGLGRDGRVYLFDTLLGFRAARDWADFDPRDTRVNAFRARCRDTAAALWARQAAVSPDAGDRWSHRLNVHHLKVLPFLAQEMPETASSIVAFARRCLDEKFSEGWFRAYGPGEPVYLHAHAYAVEGLAVFCDRSDDVHNFWVHNDLTIEQQRAYEQAYSFAGNFPYWTQLGAAARVLAAAQRGDGSLPRTWPSPENAPAAHDATAQAVRIWQSSLEDGYRENIDAALDYLRAVAGESGGIPYSDDTPHLNTWATIFAVQAFVTGNAGLDPDGVI